MQQFGEQALKFAIELQILDAMVVHRGFPNLSTTSLFQPGINF
jgi:hypothetical protein